VGVAQVELESGKFIRINQKYCDILGYSQEEAERVDFHSITHLDDVSLGREIVEELKSGKIRHASLEKRYIRKDGSSVWVNLTTAAMWAPGEAPRFVVTVAEDISERKKAEFELKKIAMLTDSSSDFVGMCDLDMNPIYVNAAGLRMVGLPDMAAACRVKVRDYFFPEDQSFIDEVFFPKVLREGHGAKEMRLRHFQTGKSIWVVYTLFSVLDESGKAVGWATVSRDISKRRLDAKRIRQGFVATIATIAKIVEVRDPYTSGHQDRVSQLSIAIAEEMRLGKDRIEGIGIGAKIHDIGKIQIPAEILSKPGKLSSTEYGLIQSHPETGFAILKDIDFPWPVAEIAHQHHERIDGSGYPQGLKGDEILLEARIVAVADVIEAMSSHRPYRPAVGVDVALEEIKAHRGTKYDAAVVDVCLRLFAEKRFLFDPVS
jgi:PAS domain S-box-containing protein